MPREANFGLVKHSERFELRFDFEFSSLNQSFIVVSLRSCLLSLGLKLPGVSSVRNEIFCNELIAKRAHGARSRLVSSFSLFDHFRYSFLSDSGHITTFKISGQNAPWVL